MKLKLNPCVLLFFYVSLVTLANHFFQHPKQGNQEMESLSHVSTGISHHMMKEKNVANPLANKQQLIGGQIMDEECENDGEECLMKRRMTIAEAHLDYIYTQHHNP